jgi:allantoinase
MEPLKSTHSGRHYGNGPVKMLPFIEISDLRLRPLGLARPYAGRNAPIRERTNPNPIVALMAMLLGIMGLSISGGLARSADSTDWITAMPREPVRVSAWPGGRKVAVCFVLYVEVWGYGRGPNFRPDMINRDSDVGDEAFREYAINWGIERVGRLFKEQQLPLSLALNAQFPEQRPAVWKALRSLVPDAPVIAHGLNNSTELLPLGRGLEA